MSDRRDRVRGRMMQPKAPSSVRPQPARVERAPIARPPGNQHALAAAGLRPRFVVAPASSPDEHAADRAATAFEHAKPAPSVSSARGSGEGPHSPVGSAQSAAVQAAMAASHGQPLPQPVKSEYERFFQRDLGAVRVFADASAAQAARLLQASAFTHQDAIYFGASRYQPNMAAGRRLLAHEIAHTHQPHRTFDGVPSPIIRRQPDPAPNPAPAATTTLDSLIQANPPGFTDAALNQAYQAYRRGTTDPSDPRTWALRQTTGPPRVRLEQLLGPDYARGSLTGVAAPPVNVRQATSPQGYDPARQSADLAALSGQSQALSARLQGMEAAQPAEGQVTAGHFNILQGNVGEILARPVLDQALADVRREAPDAQLYMGVRARVVRSDGTVSDPVLFSDGVIAAVRPGGLQIFRVAEIKSGEAGGVQGQEQIHRWIEGHSTQTIEILLPGVARTFRLSDTIREVVGLARAPRMLIVPRGAQFTTERSGHGVAAPVQRIEMTQSAEEINYLTRLVAQQLLQVQQARRLLEQAAQRQIAPGNVERIEQLQSPTVVRRLLAENNGTALVRGELYRVSIQGTSTRVQALPANTIAVPRLPPGVAGGGPQATPLLPPGGASTGRTGGIPGPSPGAGGAPVDVPLPLPATGLVPPNILNFTEGNIVVGGRVVAPTAQVGAESLRVGELIVVGYSTHWVVADMRTRQPVAGVFEGGQWYRVVSGGRVLPLDANGRVRTDVMPIPFAELPEVARRQPSGPGGGGGGSGAGGPGGGTRVVAGGMGLLVLANEILGGIGRVLQVQRYNIAHGRAEINFWIEFGANPTFGVWSQNDRVPLGADAEPETAAIYGSPSFPYVADIDVNAFRAALPPRITTHHDLLLFLDLAKTLSTIVEDPLMPQFPSPEERRQPRRYYAVVNKHDRGARIRYDVTDLIAGIRDRTVGALDEQMRSRVRGLPAAEQRNIFRLRSSSATPLFRSARGGQPILSDQQLLGDNPWVHPVGRRIEGSAWGWFRYAGGGNDRVLVEPANADAARGVAVAVYAVKEEIDDVLDEVREGGRPILQRTPAEGRLESFVAGPDPQGTRFGETRYYRHPEQPNNQTAAIGELKQFWVNGDDLEPVTEADVTAYANPPARPAEPQ